MTFTAPLAADIKFPLYALPSPDLFWLVVCCPHLGMMWTALYMAMAWDWMPFSCTSVDEYVNGDEGRKGREGGRRGGMKQEKE